MKIATRWTVLVLSVVGIVFLARLSSINRRLADQIAQLEAELGQMPIDDVDRVHVTEIATPAVPPEIAAHVNRVWQFRCYLPPGYDFARHSGEGQVTEEGVYQNGSSGSGWSSPQSEATHTLFSISFQRKGDRYEVFYSIGGSSGTTSSASFDPTKIDGGLVVQKLVSSETGPRSFDQETILPILKIFDPATAEEKEIGGQKMTTYSGVLFVLCPKSRESRFDQLKRGITPSDFDPKEIARGVGNE